MKRIILVCALSLFGTQMFSQTITPSNAFENPSPVSGTNAATLQSSTTPALVKNEQDAVYILPANAFENAVLVPQKSMESDSAKSESKTQVLAMPAKKE